MLVDQVNRTYLPVSVPQATALISPSRCPSQAPSLLAASVPRQGSNAWLTHEPSCSKIFSLTFLPARVTQGLLPQKYGATEIRASWQRCHVSEISAHGRQEQENHQTLEDSLVYIVSSRSARADPIFKKKNVKKETRFQSDFSG